MPAPHSHRWAGTPYEPVIEIGYPYEVGPEFRYDTALLRHRPAGTGRGGCGTASSAK